METSATTPQTDDAPPPFRLESIDRVMELPVVEAAFVQGASAYERIKGSNYVFEWALSTAETTVRRALDAASPYVRKLDGPIHAVDQTLVRGIEALRVRAPIVAEEPQRVCEAAGSLAQPTLDGVDCVKSFGCRKASTLRELSWNKANEVLATQYGRMAVAGVDSTSALVERLVDHYFPPAADEPERDAPISATEDPALHAVQTVGRLSDKAARRLYGSVSAQLSSLKATDVKEYITSLIVVLQLTQILHHFNDKLPKFKETDSDPDSDKDDKK